MTFTFFSNFLNHHQLPLCQAWYAALGDGFTFVATQPLDKTQVAASYQDMNTAHPFCLASYASEENRQRAQRLALESDVVLYGAVPAALFAPRLRQRKLTFRYSERIFKPYYTKNMLYTWACAVWEGLRYGRGECTYLLTAGAYAAHDYAVAGAFAGRAYRWGYFPATEVAADADKKENVLCDVPLRLLWAGRMIAYKHAEKVFSLLHALRGKGIPFRLTMAGDGPLLASMRQQAMPFGEAVTFVGTLSTQAMRELMQESDIFLFTSDESEGWGAVLSEAMSDGCAVLASNRAGASPVLIDSGVNGLLFDFEQENDFVAKGVALAQDAALRERLGEKAAQTMREEWNAPVAAQRFLELSTALLRGDTPPCWVQGPCSKDPALSIKQMRRLLHGRKP